MTTPINQLTGKIVEQDGKGTQSFMAWALQVFQICFATSQGGTTAQRPTGNTAILYLYRFYFDTSLGKPIWLKSVNPNVWVDATGATV